MRMRKGYSSCCVCVYVCLCVSITVLAATYLVYKSQIGCYKVPCGVSNVCIVWILLKTLCSPVLASFAYNRCLASTLSDETLMDRMNNSGPTIFKIQSVYFQR